MHLRDTGTGPRQGSGYLELPGWRSLVEKPGTEAGRAVQRKLIGTVEAGVAEMSLPACVIHDAGSRSMVLFMATQYSCTAATADYGNGWEDHFLPRPWPIHLIPADTSYRWVINGPAQLIALQWDLREVWEYFPELRHVKPSALEPLTRYGFEDPLIQQLILRLWCEASAEHPHGKLLTDSLFSSLLLALVARPAPPYPPPRVRERMTPVQYKRVTEYLHACFQADIGLRDLAAVAGLSASHFSRCFKAASGTSPYRYLLNLRIGRSKVLLETTSLDMSSIAQQVGFEDQSQFTKNFRRVTGVTPSAYRIEQRGMRR